MPRHTLAFVVVLGVGACGETDGDADATSGTGVDGPSTGAATTTAGATDAASSTGSDDGTTSAPPPATDGSSSAAADGTDSSGGASDATGDGVVTFDEVHPVFADHCGPCHTGASLGGHQIGAANLETAYASSQQSAIACAGLSVGACTIVRIQAGEMPMKGGCTGDPRLDAGTPACLTAAEQDLVQAWIDGGELP